MRGRELALGGHDTSAHTCPFCHASHPAWFTQLLSLCAQYCVQELELDGPARNVVAASCSWWVDCVCGGRGGTKKGSCRCGARCGDPCFSGVGRVKKPQPAAGGWTVWEGAPQGLCRYGA